MGHSMEILQDKKCRQILIVSFGIRPDHCTRVGTYPGEHDEKQGDKQDHQQVTPEMARQFLACQFTGLPKI